MPSLDHRSWPGCPASIATGPTPLAKALSAIGASGLVFIVVAAVLSARSRRAEPVVVMLVTVILADASLAGLDAEPFHRPRPSLAHADVHALVAVPGNAFDAERPCLDRVRVLPSSLAGWRR